MSANEACRVSWSGSALTADAGAPHTTQAVVAATTGYNNTIEDVEQCTIVHKSATTGGADRRAPPASS